MLNELRTRIDKVDHEILRLLSERFKIVEQVGEYKRANGIEVLQPKRWEELLQDRITYGKDLGLDEVMIANIWESIHSGAIIREKLS